jgi:hypothetical protein
VRLRLHSWLRQRPVRGLQDAPPSSCEADCSRQASESAQQNKCECGLGGTHALAVTLVTFATKRITAQRAAPSLHASDGQARAFGLRIHDEERGHSPNQDCCDSGRLAARQLGGIHGHSLRPLRNRGAPTQSPLIRKKTMLLAGRAGVTADGGSRPNRAPSGTALAADRATAEWLGLTLRLRDGFGGLRRVA